MKFIETFETYGNAVILVDYLHKSKIDCLISMSTDDFYGMYDVTINTGDDKPNTGGYIRGIAEGIRLTNESE